MANPKGLDIEIEKLENLEQPKIERMRELENLEKEKLEELRLEIIEIENLERIAIENLERIEIEKQKIEKERRANLTNKLFIIPKETLLPYFLRYVSLSIKQEKEKRTTREYIEIVEMMQ